jgi:hypothetical protein
MAYQPETKSKISTDNSTTTLLTNGSTYTGTWEDCSAYADVIVAVKTDQNGIFYVDFSPDGDNVDSTLTKYYNTTDIEAPHRFTVTRQYFRVRFTNDSGSDQTFLRLQTSLKESSNDLNVPLDQPIARDYDSISVRPSDYHDEIALGLRQGSTLWNKFGYNNDIDTGTELVASFGGTFAPLTSASTLTFVSSSTADDDGGTGANSVIVYGVDANRKSQLEIVTMDGTNNVVTSSTWLGINRVAIYTVGSGQVNAGTITVTATTGGSTQAEMPAGEGTTQQCIFFTQANHQGLFKWLELNCLKLSGSSPKVTVKAWVFSAVTNAKYEVFRLNIDTAVENTLQFMPPIPFVVGEKSAFWLEATTNADNTALSARFSLVEVKDKDAD